MVPSKLKNILQQIPNESLKPQYNFELFLNFIKVAAMNTIKRHLTILDKTIETPI